MWLISLFAVIICSYFMAKMTANLISTQFQGGKVPPSVKVSSSSLGAEGESLSLAATKPIVDRNIFDSRDVQVPVDPTTKEEEETTATPTGEAVKTSLGIKLVSTFAVGAGEDKRSTCIISSGKGRKGAEEVYTVDDEKEFAPDTRIVKIKFDRVEFVHKGRLEYVELEDFAKNLNLNVPPKRESTPSRVVDRKGSADPKVEQSSDGKFTIARSEVDAAINNLDKLYTQIRAVPYFKDGKSSGLKLLSVKGGSIFSKLGLKRGDILKSINSMELDIKRGLEIFNQLKSESNITIDIERRGQDKTLEYEIR